jgi:hypothetical protein
VVVSAAEQRSDESEHLSPLVARLSAELLVSWMRMSAEETVKVRDGITLVTQESVRQVFCFWE